MTDYAQARANMVEGQLRTNGITDPGILRSFGLIPREAFVGGDLARSAYVDAGIALPDGGFLMEPLVLARMIQAAEPQLADEVLNLGDETGYSSALLSDLVARVVAPGARPGWAALGYQNIAAVKDATPHGLADFGPYSLILVNGAVAEIPRAWLDLLGPGGRLVAVLRAAGQAGAVTLVTKEGAQRRLFDASIPYLPGYAPLPEFQF